jgi:hypothetical protein
MLSGVFASLRLTLALGAWRYLYICSDVAMPPPPPGRKQTFKVQGSMVQQFNSSMFSGLHHPPPGGLPLAALATLPCRLISAKASANQALQHLQYLQRIFPARRGGRKKEVSVIRNC